MRYATNIHDQICCNTHGSSVKGSLRQKALTGCQRLLEGIATFLADDIAPVLPQDVMVNVVYGLQTQNRRGPRARIGQRKQKTPSQLTS